MLTITHPEIFPELVSFPGGLWPLRLSEEEATRLIIKCPKEYMLAAKVKREFRFYLVPLTADGSSSYGLVTAFFDDHDEPLTFWSPLFDDQMTIDIRQLLSSDHFKIHFLDEHNRELLGYSAKNDDAPRFRAFAETMNFLPFSFHLARDFLDQMPDWFGRRTTLDDEQSFAIHLQEPLFPEDLYISDVRPEVNSYHGKKTNMHTVLERDDAGHFSELDIVHALHRTFASDQIYLNPIRPDDGKEFVDVLVITASAILLIQAKDSPNTERALQRSIERKKSTVVSHLTKATAQLRGSISYAQQNHSLTFLTNGIVHKIDVGRRDIIGLIVVKELFMNEFSVYTPPVMGIFDDTGIPCFVLDYPELHNYTLHLRTEDAFIGALEQVFKVARERGEFPRLRFGLTPSS
ncbi:hypothetical protein FB595_103228 [Sphingobium sp. AEW010]|nr:hypothetical protein C7E20_01145 [Sphingobium sp. AEW4]TWD10661.1 hypothetical protein FB595_103228 [Sphingobium sp. AEW010]TWD27934.1 hypothetical protein FB596_10387 [Sphingobium sp. AEW013]TWD28995.1 hypothetical protein FB594_103228 [Sphingobium sp. AEW001]